MKPSFTPTDAERQLRKAMRKMDADYQALKRENEALRDEIHILRQQLPTVGQALRESPAAFADAFVEI